MALTVQAANASASTYQVIYHAKGAVPDVLAVGEDGALFGTVISTANEVFALTPPPEGASAWAGHVLYTFGQDVASTGDYPAGGVTLDRNAVLGTSQAGGVYSDGIIYRINLPAAVTFTNLHSFAGKQANPTDGASPLSGLTPGLNRLYYGATKAGGVGNSGTLFAVSASTSNPKYRVLYRFGRTGDGVTPGYGRLTVDAQGSLYGTTTYGGANDTGTVYSLQYLNGGWKEQVLYSFAATGDLQKPQSDVVFDSQGNLYGCAQGGSHNSGGLFRLTPPAQGTTTWTETVLYNFGDKLNNPNTTYSACGVTLNPATGGLVGTSYGGGQHGVGSVFEANPPAAGKLEWTLTIIHSFDSTPNDGAHAGAAPLMVGSVYYAGNDVGAIYQFTP